MAFNNACCTFCASFFHSWPGWITPNGGYDSQPLNFWARKKSPQRLGHEIRRTWRANSWFWRVSHVECQTCFGQRDFTCEKHQFPWAVCAGWEFQRVVKLSRSSSSSKMIKQLGRDVGFWWVSVDVKTSFLDTFPKETWLIKSFFNASLCLFSIAAGWSCWSPSVKIVKKWANNVHGGVGD